MASALKFANVVIYVDDVPATIDFYRRAAGLEPSFYDAELGFALMGETQSISIASHAAGALMLEDGYQRIIGDRVSRTELAFWSDDVAADCVTAVNAGATILSPPRVIPWGQTIAYVEAPEGTILGFISQIR